MKDESKVTLKEARPLQWPEGWVRTRIQDQAARSAWKKSLKLYVVDLERELLRLGVTSVLVSWNYDPAEREPRDPGAAVYFSRKAQEDFSWQDILHVTGPAPSLNEIDDAYHVLAKKYHPDNAASGDVEMFKKIKAAQQQAIRWINRREHESHDFVIACDKFKELRWNVNAIARTIYNMRQIEIFGTSAFLERAFRGFATAQLTEGPPQGRTAASA